MSSGAEFGGVIAAAVVGTAGIALGAGWMLWSAGKLVVDANRAIDEDIRRTKELQRLEQEQRRAMALRGRQQLEQLCRSQRQALSTARPGESDADRREREELCRELDRILAEEPSADSRMLESRNAMHLNQVERLLSRYEGGRARRSRVAAGDQALTEKLECLRTAFAAARLEETRGEDAAAPDPAVLERAELNRRLIPLGAWVNQALALLAEFERDFGLSEANRAWYHSCFDGVDREIALLCDPQTDNTRLKTGLRRLEEILRQAEMLLPEVQKEMDRFAALYPVYRQAAQALLADVQPPRAFDTADALEREMKRLQQREKQAEKCRRIYEKLGQAGYLCYAWDQELRAMGYQVYDRDAVRRMAESRPVYASPEGKKLPFYQWDPETMTQFYQVESGCSLQLVVHPDGTTTMQTITEGDEDRAVQTQKKHCAALAALRQRLRDNWFISYDQKETAPPELLLSTAAWRGSRDNAWRGQEETGIRENRPEEKGKERKAK